MTIETVSELRAAVEAILFAVSEPVTAKQIAAALGISEVDAVTEIEAIARDRNESDAGVVVRQTGDGYRFYTSDLVAAQVKLFATRSKTAKLSKAALETLAVVAWRQPTTRAHIARIRGVDSQSALSTLIEHGLVDEIGREDTPGRPQIYSTTQLFLEKTGLGSLKELEPLATFAPDVETAERVERALAPKALSALNEDVN